MSLININPWMYQASWTLHAFYDFKTSQPWTLPDRADDWKTWQSDNGTTLISEEATEGWRIYTTGDDLGLQHQTLLPQTGEDLKITVVVDSVTSGTIRVVAGDTTRGTITTAGTYVYEYANSVNDNFYLKRDGTGVQTEWVCRSVKVEKK